MALRGESLTLTLFGGRPLIVLLSISVEERHIDDQLTVRVSRRRAV